jgi:hypothetical protein
MPSRVALGAASRCGCTQRQQLGCFTSALLVAFSFLPVQQHV